MAGKSKNNGAPCPCGNGAYRDCCARYIDTGAAAPTAAALMRSRYSAFALRNEAYLRATWWPETLPEESLTGDDVKWTELVIVDKKKRAGAQTVAANTDSGSDADTVEFIARFKVGGRGHKLHEISNFRSRTDSAGVARWYYVDGIFPDDA